MPFWSLNYQINLKLVRDFLAEQIKASAISLILYYFVFPPQNCYHKVIECIHFEQIG